MKSFLFAYGTLQPVIAPPELRGVLKKLHPVGRAVTNGTMVDLGEYPGAVFDENADTTVQGIVYRLPGSKQSADDVLFQLDEYEGVDRSRPQQGLSVRRKLPLDLRSGRRLDCWVYEYAGEQRFPTIGSGTFPKRRARAARGRRAGVGASS